MRTIPICYVEVKLSGFGFSRMFSTLSTSMTMTTVGTIPYAAPEIRESIENNENTSQATASCDIFSAAVVIHEIITGNVKRGNGF